MVIKFIPEIDKKEIRDASDKYRQFWSERGKDIIDSIEKISRLKFSTKKLDAIIYEGVSTSHPLKLRASYSSDEKKGTLIHELCHILLVDNKITAKTSLDVHKKINPILYKVWKQLYGEEFANKIIAAEKERGVVYKKAWEQFIL